MVVAVCASACASSRPPHACSLSAGALRAAVSAKVLSVSGAGSQPPETRRKRGSGSAEHARALIRANARLRHELVTPGDLARLASRASSAASSQRRRCSGERCTHREREPPTQPGGSIEQRPLGLETRHRSATTYSRARLHHEHERRFARSVVPEGTARLPATSVASVRSAAEALGADAGSYGTRSTVHSQGRIRRAFRRLARERASAVRPAEP